MSDKLHVLTIDTRAEACRLAAVGSVVQPTLRGTELVTGMLATISCAKTEEFLRVERVRRIPFGATSKEVTMAQGQAKVMVVQAAQVALGERCVGCAFNTDK